jgi:methyl-accepting chemotaxis protein
VKLTIGAKSVAVAVSAVVVTAAAGLAIQKAVIYRQGASMTEEKMRAIVLGAENARQSMSGLQAAGAIDRARLLAEARQSGELRATTLYRTIPVAAAWRSIEDVAAKEGFEFRVPSTEPRNPKNSPTAEEAAILGELASDRAEEYFRVDKQSRRITYARAIRLTADCLGCHGDPARSPSGDGKDIVGYRMEGWREGERHGAFLLRTRTAKIDEVVRAGMWQAAFWLIPVAFGVGLLSYVMMRRISRPLAGAVRVLDRVAEGDLTQRLEVETEDEVGRMGTALNQALGRIHQAIGEIQSGARSLAVASGELASASDQLSSGAQQQAASLEQTSASLEQITATVKQNASNARQANQLAAGSREAAEKGGRVVNAAVSAMGEINASSTRIADIITTIDEIAFQTNLLALNAAVEAARAGEQGRGFAVVASEVRSLAQRSATAAKEIKTLIEDSLRKVDSGAGLVNQSGQTLGEIVSSVKRVTDIVSEIAAASAEQATGIEQVSKAMAQMDQVTQANSAQTEELSATAQTLNRQAEKMRELTARFELGRAEGGRAASRNVAPGRDRREATAADLAAMQAVHDSEEQQFAPILDRDADEKS